MLKCALEKSSFLAQLRDAVGDVLALLVAAGAGEDVDLLVLDIADAFHQVIRQVGSYGEVYDRNLNPVGLYREGSANAGWLDGGLIYSPPAR